MADILICVVNNDIDVVVLVNTLVVQLCNISYFGVHYVISH